MTPFPYRPPLPHPLSFLSLPSMPWDCQRLFFADTDSKQKDRPIVAASLGAILGGLLVVLIALFIWWAAVRWRKHGKLFCFNSHYQARRQQEVVQLPRPIGKHARALANDVEAGYQSGGGPRGDSVDDHPVLDAGAKSRLSDVEEGRTDIPQERQLRESDFGASVN